MSKTKYNHWRSWLEPLVGGVVDSYVRVQPWGYAKGVTLKIADCTRSISLEFEDTAVSKRKLRILREALDRVEQEMGR